MTTTTQRNEFIREWQKDLRSGKYEQGRAQLKDMDGRYCCLGVACETAHRMGITSEPFGRVTQREHYSVPGEWSHEYLGCSSDPLVEPDPETMYPRKATGLWPLTRLNDTAGLSFDQIADLLDQLIVEEGEEEGGGA